MCIMYVKNFVSLGEGFQKNFFFRKFDYGRKYDNAPAT